jgi:hypothetical protein
VTAQVVSKLDTGHETFMNSPVTPADIIALPQASYASSVCGAESPAPTCSD